MNNWKQLIMVITVMVCCGCTSRNEMKAETLTDPENMTINITIDGKTMSLVLVDNKATQALVEALQEGAITYEADDYGGFEKVGALGRSLPTNDTRLTTQAGDVILYNGNQIVLFYGSNTWSYTRIGRIEYSSQTELEGFLKAGEGRIRVTLSLQEATGIKRTETGSDAEAYISMSGIRVSAPEGKGVFIHKGKKMRF